MDKKFFIETEQLENKNDGLNIINPIGITNDNLVNDFLNQDVSLESLIEKEIYNKKWNV
mgnify:CR=1 FL=1